MQELNILEVDAVSGGLSPDNAGLAIIALAFVAGPAMIGAAALGIGLGLLIGPHIAYSVR